MRYYDLQSSRTENNTYIIYVLWLPAHEQLLPLIWKIKFCPPSLLYDDAYGLLLNIPVPIRITQWKPIYQRHSPECIDGQCDGNR